VARLPIQKRQPRHALPARTALEVKVTSDWVACKVIFAWRCELATDGEVFRVAARVTGPQGQDIVNVHHFRAFLATPMDDVGFALRLRTALKNIYATLNNVQADDYVPADIKVDCVEMQSGKEVVVRSLGASPWPSGYTPAAGGAPLAPQNAALIKFATLGVRTLAKKFVPGFTVSGLDANGVPTADVMAALVAWADYLVNDVMFSPGNGVRAVVWGKRAQTWLDLIGAVVDAIWSTQRRRKVGYGS